MKLLFPLLLVLNLFLGDLYSQTRYGLNHSNYSGIQGIMNNPANLVNNPLAWDYNLLGINLFVDNNLMTIPNNSLLTIGGKDFRAIPDYFPRTNLSETAYLVMNVSKKWTRLGLDLKINGPAFMYSSQNVSIGFFQNVRANVTMKNINKNVIDFFFDDMSAEAILLGGIDIKNLVLNGLVWTETGFSYGEYLVNDQFYKIKAGGSVKLLNGVSGYAINIKELSFQPDPTISVDDNIDNIGFNLSYAYTNPNKFGGTRSFFNAYGLALDAGLLIEEHKIYKKRFATYRQKYEWQLGVSLLDIGAIAFTKKRSTAQSFDNIQDFKKDLDQNRIDNGDYLGAINDRIRDASDYKSNQKTPYFILPAAINMHIDRNIHQNFYLNSRLVLGIPSFGMDNMLRASSNFIISPRFESKHIDLSFPFILHDWRHIRYGFNTRLSFLTIGSDNIANIFRKNGTVTGADIYFSIRLYRNRHLQKKENKLQQWLRRRKRRVDQKHFKMISPIF